MKPINAFEIRKSHQTFILNFSFLTIFSVFCIYLFFAAADKEYSLLAKKAEETEKLAQQRKEININFDIIMLRFKELSRYKSYNADELSKQAILLDDIQNANYKIKDLINKKDKVRNSFVLYEKMNNNVSVMASLQDSLFAVRYSIESYRDQLNNCGKINKAAVKKIRGGIFAR